MKKKRKERKDHGKYRDRLIEERQKLTGSINRNRLSQEEIQLEKTEDDGELATISHDKELLYNLHESDYQRLASIRDALSRINRGEYGECVRCRQEIEEKRLDAVPWATRCIQCQEAQEAEPVLRPVLAGKFKEGEDEED